MTEIPFQRFVEVRAAATPALSPDGRSLAYVSNLTGYPEAYRHSGVGRTPQQLTEFRERVSDIRWTPDGKRLVTSIAEIRDRHERQPSIDGSII